MKGHKRADKNNIKKMKKKKQDERKGKKMKTGTAIRWISTMTARRPTTSW